MIKDHCSSKSFLLISIILVEGIFIKKKNLCILLFYVSNQTIHKNNLCTINTNITNICIINSNIIKTLYLNYSYTLPNDSRLKKSVDIIYEPT